MKQNMNLQDTDLSVLFVVCVLICRWMQVEMEKNFVRACASCVC